jgi:hypothetical protein
MLYELCLVFFMWVCLNDYKAVLGTASHNTNLGMNVVGVSVAVAYLLEQIERDTLPPALAFALSISIGCYLTVLVYKILLVLDHRK